LTGGADGARCQDAFAAVLASERPQLTKIKPLLEDLERQVRALA
jgi:hypothetical protein